ncbi:MAG: HD domain-containing protein, partial [Planctomycetota bacterium]|nr:HD domain-containing protein [Planctomycetota bacterium]
MPAYPRPSNADSLWAKLFALPTGCLRLVSRLREAGHRTWWCGGTVRDLVRGSVPRDLDLATDALPEAVRAAVPGAWLAENQPGESLGTLMLEVEGRSVEVTTLRRDGAYVEGRAPSEVEFVLDPAEDWQRRDFTMNALYLDPATGDLVDPSGGMQDLWAHRLRVIGPARERLREDPLRILRALRLCAEHGLVMDRATWRAVVDCAGEVARLSRERLRLELERLLIARGRARGLQLLLRSGVAHHVLPWLPPLAEVPQPEDHHPEGAVLGHTAQVLGNLRDPPTAALAWAALFHDVGKKETFVQEGGRIRFPGHDVLSARFAEQWLFEHGATAALRREVVALIEQHIRITCVPSFRPMKRARFLQSSLFAAHLE